MSKEKTTVNRLLLNRDDSEKVLVLKWANLAASNGGSFQIIQRYESEWVSYVTINWPEGVTYE